MICFWKDECNELEAKATAIEAEMERQAQETQAMVAKVRSESLSRPPSTGGLTLQDSQPRGGHSISVSASVSVPPEGTPRTSTIECQLALIP